MTQEDEKLLIKDFYARLPYDELYVKWSDGEIENIAKRRHCVPTAVITNSKMFLRPMSSMTEEEKREIYDWLVENDVDWFDFSKLRLDEILISFDSSWLLVNWLIAHHFDFRNLIGRGLAIEVTEENNPYKK